MQDMQSDSRGPLSTEGTPDVSNLSYVDLLADRERLAGALRLALTWCPRCRGRGVVVDFPIRSPLRPCDLCETARAALAPDAAAVRGGGE
jgi:hypothetical protein